MSDMVVRRLPGLVEARLDGELVGLHVEQGTCYGFNATATRIWSMLEQPMRASELREELMREFDVDAETCARQLDALLKEFERDGLVELEKVSS